MATAEHEVAVPDGAADPPPAQQPGTQLDTIKMIAVLMGAAGLVHGGIMADLFGHWAGYGAVFLVVTYAQVLWAVWLHRHPTVHRRVLLYGAIACLLLVVVSVVTQTVSIHIAPNGASPRSVASMDFVAILDEFAVAGLVAVIIAPQSRIGRRLMWLAGGQSMRLAVMLCAASFCAVVFGLLHRHPPVVKAPPAAIVGAVRR